MHWWLIQSHFCPVLELSKMGWKVEMGLQPPTPVNSNPAFAAKVLLVSKGVDA